MPDPSLLRRIERGLTLSGLDPRAAVICEPPEPDLRPIGWHVASVFEGREARLVAALEKAGIAVWCPVKRIVTTYRNQWTRTVAEPLFPGYLFLAFPAGEAPDCRAFARDGMAGLLHRAGAPDCPAEVPKDAVDALIRAEFEGRFDEQRKPRSREVTERAMEAKDLHAGDTVRLNEDGPWSSVIARLEGAASDLRVAVLLDMLGRKVRATVPLARVRKA